MRKGEVTMQTRKIKLISLAVAVGLVLLGFNVTNVSAFQILTEDDVVKEVITKEELVRLVDNFIVLYDTSGSMDAMYKDTGLRRIEVAKKILQERNQLIPELGYKAGLYHFTTTKPVYDLKTYNRMEFGKAIDNLTTTTRVPPNRRQMMMDLDRFLAGVSGRTAVFLFTDGEFVAPTKGQAPVVSMAKEMVGKYDICLYPISSAKTPRQKANVEALAAVNECSRVIPFDALYGRPEYVGGVLFDVEDIMIVEEGVMTRVAAVQADNILYDFDRYDIRPEFNQELDELGKFLQSKPDTYAVIDGHTDNIGTEEYNLGLSRRRAESVAGYLINNHNISSDRVVVLWYGMTNPVASNATPEGRALNRRVEIAVGGSM
jgi:OOP family OmpA-OmpF porin